MAQNFFDNLDIAAILQNLPDSQGVLELLAPQELDILASVIYSGLNKGFDQIVAGKVEDPVKQQALMTEALVAELKNISAEISIPELEKKIDIAGFLNKTLSSRPA